jgi:hypothetical protein
VPEEEMTWTPCGFFILRDCTPEEAKANGEWIRK